LYCNKTYKKKLAIRFGGVIYHAEKEKGKAMFDTTTQHRILPDHTQAKVALSCRGQGKLSIFTTDHTQSFFALIKSIIIKKQLYTALFPPPC